jgi:RNA polymerase sigma factor (sigma-70 family)
MTTTDPATDAALLATFARTRSEAAFAELVRRHGPLVQGVCRRVLGDEPEADDAFQAVFLVLARKAGGVRDPSRLGPWLYGVAVRVAGKAKAARSKRRRRERPMGEVPAPERDSDWADVRPVLDAEIAWLPAKLQAALVLCELQQVSREDAAARLGVPAGTLSSRLARAKDMLRARLVRRGLTLSAAGLGAVLTEAKATAVPAALVYDTAAEAVAVPPGALIMAGKLKLLLGLALLGGLAAGAKVLADRLRPDWRALEGEWVVEGSVNDYSPFSRPTPVFGPRFIIAGGTLTPDPAVGGSLAIALDPWHSPRRIDLTASGVRGLADGQVVPGVYAVDGDTLTLNLAVRPGQSRPPETDRVLIYVWPQPRTADIGNPDHASRQYVLRRVRPGRPDPAADLARLFGRWRLVGLERGGELDPPQTPCEFHFNGDHLYWSGVVGDGEQPGEQFRVRLDGTRSPGWIDLAPRGGGNAPPVPGAKPRSGVYELDGDKLALRWGDARPASMAGAGPAVYRLERVKP